MRIIFFLILLSAFIIIPITYTWAVSPPDPPKWTNGTVGTVSITTSWSAPLTNGGSGTIFYNVKRSENGLTFTSLTNTSSKTYIDTTAYPNSAYKYYRIYSNDTAGQSTGYAFPLNTTMVASERTHMPYDSTLNDQGKKNDTPTSTGGTTYITGHNGMARNLNGTQYDTFATESNFDWSRTDALTFSFWIKYNLQVNKIIFAKGANPVALASNGTSIWDDGGTINLEMDGSTEQLRVRSISTNIDDNAWHHVAITKPANSNATNVKIYLDGVSQFVGVVTNTLTSQSILNNRAAVLGDNSDHIGGAKFTGGIDDFRIFYQKELNAYEVSQLYNERLGTTGYIALPAAVTTLSSEHLGNNKVDLIWSQPTLNGGTLTNYKVQYKTPWGTPTTFLANTTNTYYNVTGLAFGTQYSFNVSPLNQHGYNTTGNIVNITTTSTTYNTPPTGLIASSNNSTKINLQWTAGTMTNVNGYRIERETPLGSGWNVIVSNTTNTNIYYNNTGLTTNIIYNYRVSSLNTTGISTPSNTYSMTTYHIPNGVTDLSATVTDFSTVDLLWSTPTSFAPAILGYMINTTTPYGSPLTILVSNTGSTTTSATIGNLIIGSDYSFRVSPVTIHGTNASGNIANVTTTSLITLGDLPTTSSANTDDFSIFFSRTDINSTALFLNVTYPNTYDLDCNFAYQFARSNNTYGNLSSTVIDANTLRSDFEFVNVTGDIVHVKCWDTITSDEARYVLTITQFPFLDQIDNMRNGTYGTYFKIGAIDGITLMICILAMIGFNRSNPVAGMIFLVITIGTLSWFQIITYPIVMYPALALLVVWGYYSTRKDD